MPKENSSSKRNVEIIRRKNLEDNQNFLKQLLINDIRKDFVSSARSFLPPRKPFYRTYEKIEHATRYNEKVKSGEIPVHVPEYQRLREAKKKAAELRQLAKEENQRKRLELKKLRKRIEQRRQRKRKVSKWTLFEQRNSRPYERIFQPRQTKLDERIKRELNQINK